MNRVAACSSIPRLAEGSRIPAAASSFVRFLGTALLRDWDVTSRSYFGADVTSEARIWGCFIPVSIPVPLRPYQLGLFGVRRLRRDFAASILNKGLIEGLAQDSRFIGFCRCSWNLDYYIADSTTWQGHHED